MKRWRKRCLAPKHPDCSIFPIFVSWEQPQRKLLISLGEKISPGSLYKYCNLLCTVHLEPLRTYLLEIIHH